MAFITRRPYITDDVRHANDRHRHWVPVVVVSFLLLVTYLWTDWMDDYPPPGIDTLASHPVLGRGISSGDHLKTSSWIWRRADMDTDDQRRVLMLLAGMGFLLSYYLPLPFKRQPLALLTLVGVAWVIGPSAMALFLACHLLAYTTFHVPDPRKKGTVAGIAVFACCVWVPTVSSLPGEMLALLLKAGVTAATLSLIYARLYYPLLNSRARSTLQALAAHSCLLYLAIALLWNVFSDGPTFPRAVGCLLFFWQWERLVTYHIDLKDGRAPKDLKLSEYLATLLSPAILSNYHWISRIPTGYAYLTNSFLARDKNRIVLSGVGLISLSVAFFYFRPVILKALWLGAQNLGIVTTSRYEQLARYFDRGLTPDVSAVWFVLIYEFLSFYFLWTAVAHLKVGLWRLFGYDIEPHFQRPFASTNLVEWWGRYSYYYRAFLVQAFYYPVYLRYFKRRPYLRIFVATFAAAGLGNLVYHLVYAGLYHGATPEVLVPRLRAFPYYLIIGFAIAFTQVWLVARRRRGRRPRRAWTWDRKISLDILAVIGTVGFFVLVRPFHHLPKDESIMDAVRLVLAALGISL